MARADAGDGNRVAEKPTDRRDVREARVERRAGKSGLVAKEDEEHIGVDLVRKDVADDPLHPDAPAEVTSGPDVGGGDAGRVLQA